MMVSTHMRGAVISTSVYEGFPSTYTQGRGIAVLRLNLSMIYINLIYSCNLLFSCRFDTK